MATPSAAQTPTTAATSAVERGRASSGVVPLQRSRHSTSLGARRSGSVLQPPSPSTAFRREITSAGTGAVMALRLGFQDHRRQYILRYIPRRDHEHLHQEPR